MSFARRFSIVAVVAALLCGLAYGVGWASQANPSLAAPGRRRQHRARRRPSRTGPSATCPTSSRPPSQADEPSDEARRRADATEAEEPTEPELVAGPTLLAPGDSGDEVRDLQARLAQIDWFNADVTGYYGDVTTEAVRGFQAKREIPVTGEVDQRTLDRLYGMTTRADPGRADQPDHHQRRPVRSTPRCLVGRVICVDKSSSTLRWVVDGEVLKTMDARFGGSATPTREGEFSVFQKSRDHVSSLYDTSMPFAMFFSNGQAVHYSPDFAAVGYDGASHGCVNTRDYDGVAWLFDQVQIGDKVVVYWS